jgi:hypothetical protein
VKFCATVAFAIAVDCEENIEESPAIVINCQGNLIAFIDYTEKIRNCKFQYNLPAKGVRSASLITSQLQVIVSELLLCSFTINFFTEIA